MSSQHERRDQRFEYQLPVVLMSRSCDVPLVTENVSFRGMFLKTSSPPPKMQLCRIRLAVPTQPSPIVTNVIAVHIVAQAGASAAGAGFSFYGLDGEPRAEWEKFIRFVRDQHTRKDNQHTGPANRQVPDSAERTKGRQLIVAVANIAAFERLITRDIGSGKLVIHTSSTLSSGDAVSVRLVHPETHNDFILEGVVAQRIGSGALSVALSKMGAAARARFGEFVKTEVEKPSIDILAFDSIRPPIRSSAPLALG